jgi:amidohydrolase
VSVTSLRALPGKVAARFTERDIEFLTTLRRDLHRTPEIAWHEHLTRARLKRAFADLGIRDVQEIARTGLVARIKGVGSAKNAPIIAIRGDIDALPITEATNLPFASETLGVMHACGHDVHATWAVGAAMLLAREHAVGEVRVILQPAEEVGQGASEILKSGALDGVQAIFGGHVDWRFRVGEVVATAGPLAASTDTFEVVFTGRGGHGARPHDAIDPIIGLGSFIVEVQTLVSRLLDPALPGVVTVGAVEAGNASNVIPERARCRGTIRATTVESRKLLCDELIRMAQAVAATHRLTAEVVLSEGTPPLVNTVRASSIAQSAVHELLGESANTALPVANMGGEDFAFYLEKMEGCFMRIGTWSDGRSRVGVHNPRFDPDEAAIFVGSAVLASTARTMARTLASAV